MKTTLLFLGLALSLAYVAKNSFSADRVDREEDREFQCTYHPEMNVTEKIDLSFHGRRGELIQIRRLGPLEDHYFAATTVGLERKYSEFGIASSSSAPLKLKATPRSFVTVSQFKGGSRIRWTRTGKDFEITCPAPSIREQE